MMYQNYEEYTGGEDFANCDSGVFNAIEERKVANESNEEPADGEANSAIKNLDKLLEGS